MFGRTRRGGAARRECAAQRPGRRPGQPRAPLPDSRPPHCARRRRQPARPGAVTWTLAAAALRALSPPRPLPARRWEVKAAARGLPGQRPSPVRPGGNWESLGARRSLLSSRLFSRVVSRSPPTSASFLLPTAQTNRRRPPCPLPVVPTSERAWVQRKLAQRTRRARSRPMSPPGNSQLKYFWAPNYRCSN